MEQCNQRLENRSGKRSLDRVSESTELSLSNEMLRAVINGACSLLIVLDTEGVVVCANRIALSHVGASLEQVTNTHFEDSGWWNHEPGQIESIRDAIHRAANGEVSHADITQNALDGDLRIVDFALSPIRDKSGLVLWLILEGRDITDVRSLEVERNDLLQRLHHSERLDSIGRLTGGIAHDFNNALTVLCSGLEMLEAEDNVGPLNLEVLNDMNDTVHSAVALTRQLLAFSRKQVRDSEDFIVDERIPSVAKLWRRALGDTIRLDVELNAPNSQVRMPVGSFEQIIVNLIVNAQDAMPNGGCMTLRTEVKSFDCLPQHAFGRGDAQGCHVVATLTDNGCGMTADTLKKAFDLFYTTKAKGTGFGLATVYGLVTQAGGFVTLESTHGAGTCVGICLPLLEQSCATDTLAPTSGVQLSSIVLTADDDNRAPRKPMSLEDIAKFLER